MPEISDPTGFASKLAKVAKGEYALYGGLDEDDSPLLDRIKEYYQHLGFDYKDEAWSAVFVSFCVKSAGATKENFSFARRHSEFVHDAINGNNTAPAFVGLPLNERAVNVGDIIANNRNDNSFDFDYAKNHEGYLSHSAVVIARGVDDNGKFAYTVGGNELHSVRRKRVSLNADGTVKQRKKDSYICLLKCLK